MQLEVGQVVNGKIIKITKFGAFVELESKINGLVHISEISNSFVSDISNFFKIGDDVKVKILNINDGKINLSIKQVNDMVAQKNINKTKVIKTSKPNLKEPAIYDNLIKKKANLTFEEMLNKFKKNSEETLSAIKHNADNKRHSYFKHK